MPCNGIAGGGHTEWADADNQALAPEEYETFVAPFVDAWEAEKLRVEDMANRPPTVSEARVAKLAESNTKCEAALAALTATYPDKELLTFERQEREARAYLAGNTTDVGHITAIAEGRGVAVALLAQKIVEKADAFSLVSGSLIGQRQKYEDALAALENDATLEDIQAILVVYALPGMASTGGSA